MWRLRGKRKPPSPTAKMKAISYATSTDTIPDILSTSLRALKESADAFPPLKSTVGAVLSVWDIAERAKHSKADAHDIALRAEAILHVVADAVPDPSSIPQPMLQSIKSFVTLLDDVQIRMNAITSTGRLSRVLHLNHNERELQTIKTQLDDACRDLLVAAALRGEVQHEQLGAQQTQLLVQQTHLGAQQTQTHLDVVKVVVATEALVPNISKLLFLHSVFFG
ncbi:hypothetical protein C8F04DRAFT_1122374 [Mycena alexandri]|uniref:Uncharacterized protein n=1 Tax=Mycena alexandri TaxID=1745969 RepID=A0AAD6SHD5_9AGAR|nr:hypothetical protein C8F04DRAFT_1122374 [Mycena alexandri]